MKAGAALGLLAGLGALNAIRGGREGTGKRFTGLMDMLDGGGAGASGDKFEGGGLLSILGNLFAKPLEAQDNVERIAADTNATKAVVDVLKKQADAEAAMGLGPFGGAGPDITQTQDGVGLDAFGGAGPTIAPQDTLGSSQGLLAAQSANEAAMGLSPFGGTGTPVSPMRQPAGTLTAPYENNEAFRQQAIQLYGQGFLDLTPTSQARIIEGLRLGASRSAY